MNDSQIEEMGLDLGVVEQHAERIKKVVAGTIESPKFEVLDTCRVSNRRILQIPPSFEGNINQDFKDYVSFVPAAGAASRYIGPLQDLPQLVQNQDFEVVKEKYLRMYQSGVLLPEPLNRFFSQVFS